MNERTAAKLLILAEAAKYDVSCSSSGVRRGNAGGLGNTCAPGVCHSFADDGRCISLLKILYTNHCVYDCAYCLSRNSNDVPRTAFTVEELVEVTMEFYRRNYIEGLFLSSGVVSSADHTMERMVKALQILRVRHKFNGYIHMKCIPGASRDLVFQAGLYADRLSVNIEIPSDRNLKLLAPQKDHQSIYAPMRHIRQKMQESREDRSKYAPHFAPAGQSTQMIIGASDERDRDILALSSLLYKGPALKRVYYSGFIPVNAYDKRLPALREAPLIREHRLYQADWLMRFYQFDAEEILSDTQPDLDLEIDPKLAWALRHPQLFPVDVNKAEYAEILRIPGVGVKSAQKIIMARRQARLGPEHLRKLGVVMKRAVWFICADQPTIQEAGPQRVRAALVVPKKQKQMSLFAN